MKPDVGLSAVAMHFALLSLLAVGGANAVVPEMHRQAVDVAGWMTDRQFTDLFALAQVAPGPNIMIVTLIGYFVGGISGGLVATLAMVGPTCVLTYFTGRLLQVYQGAWWRAAVQAALVPVAVGLIAASALVLAQTADHNALAVCITLGTAAVALFTRINPLWPFALAALLGYLGLV
ncbi:MAG: chromate transporter [Variibacter sp.]|jgi:chromate transporter|nr:chromate transporter [Variibacter sp.]